MSDKKLQQANEATVEVAEETLQNEEAVLKANAEALREDIRVLEDKEKILTEKLCLAKGKGLNAQIEKCRVLLQKLVLQKNLKKQELADAETLYKEAKAKRELAELSEEIDELTAAIEADVLDDEEDLLEEPTFEEGYDHIAKAKRLGVISRVFAFVGIFAAFIGAVVYLLCANFDLTAGFEWMDLLPFGVVAVVMIVIGLCVGGAANKHKRIAAAIEAEMEEKRAQYEAEKLERERLKAEKMAPWRAENMDAAAEANATEQAMDVQLAKEAKKADMKNKMLVGVNDVAGKLKDNVHKVVPIAAACTAVVTAAALISSGKKKAAAKRSAAARKELLNSIIDSL